MKSVVSFAIQTYALVLCFTATTRANASDIDHPGSQSSQQQSANSGRAGISPTPEAPLPSWNSQLRTAYDNSFANNVWGASLSQLLRDKFDLGQLNNLLNIRPALVAEYCPKYASMKTSDKVAYWVEFFKAMSYGESGHNKNAGPRSGIMQLTCDSTARGEIYKCQCRNNQDFVNDRRISVDCAANIVNVWAGRGQLVQDSVTRTTYFATLTRQDPSFNNNVKPRIRANRPQACTQ